MSNLEVLESRLLTSPTARARFLADTLELLEKNGVDISATLGDVISSIDLTDGASFLNGLAASTIVITRTSTGITDTSTAASTLVITRTSTGRDPSTFGGPGNAASTIVITRTSTGHLSDLANQLGTLASELQKEALRLDKTE